MENLAKAIVAVMLAVENVEKNMVVGSGNNSYSGVADKDVKIAVRGEMIKNGLCLLPIGVDAKTQIDRWEETNQYGTKTKQSVFTEATTKYLLLHSSGESIELEGYGHGVDSQDKASGKVLTYAMKTTIINLFMIATGKIDDTDNEHSDNKEVPKSKTATKEQKLQALSVTIKGDIKKAKTTADLTAIWNNCKPLQEDNAFIELIKTRRTELTPQTV